MLQMNTQSSQQFEQVGSEFKVNFDAFTRRRLSTDECNSGNLSKRDARICKNRKKLEAGNAGFMGFLIRVAEFAPITQFLALAFIFIVGWCASPFQSWPSPTIDMYCAEARVASEGVTALPELCLNAVDLLGRKNGTAFFNYGGCEIAVSTILSLGSLLYGLSNMLYSGAPTTLGLKTPGAIMQVVTFVMLFLGVYAMQDAHDADTVVSATDSRVLEAARGASLMWTAFILSCLNVGLTLLDMSV